MFEKTNKAVARRVGKVAVEAQSRNFTIRIDEPKTSGGEDTGMSPVEALLCSLGACQVVAACVFARQMRIELDDIWVEVEGDMDSAGMMGYTGIRPGYQHIRFVFHVKTDAPPARVQALIDRSAERGVEAQSRNFAVRIDEPKIILEY